MLFSQYPDIMNINDVRGALGIGRTKAYELVGSGELRSFKIGSAIRIPKTALLDYVENQRYNEEKADKRPCS